jgi:pyruvate-formate lyase-activating enzyme
MEMEDYWLLHKGFYHKELELRRMIRWAVLPIVQIQADRVVSPYKIMPLDGDEDLKKKVAQLNKTSMMSKEEAEKKLQMLEESRAQGKKSGLSISDKIKLMEALKGE